MLFNDKNHSGNRWVIIFISRKESNLAVHLRSMIRKKTYSHRPWEEFLLIVLLAAISANALYAGLGLMVEADGAWLGLSIAWLSSSPFTNYFWPGLLLFTFLGCLPALSAVGLVFRPTWKWPERGNIFPRQHWSLTFATYSGIVFCTWIAGQQLLTDYFMLQPVISMAGILVIILSLLPRVVKHCVKKPDTI